MQCTYMVNFLKSITKSLPIVKELVKKGLIIIKDVVWYKSHHIFTLGYEFEHKIFSVKTQTLNLNC